MSTELFIEHQKGICKFTATSDFFWFVEEQARKTADKQPLVIDNSNPRAFIRPYKKPHGWISFALMLLRGC